MDLLGTDRGPLGIRGAHFGKHCIKCLVTLQSEGKFVTKYSSILLNCYSNHDINFKSILKVSLPWDRAWRRLVVDCKSARVSRHVQFCNNCTTYFKRSESRNAT